jgi:hypothetical protein
MPMKVPCGEVGLTNAPPRQEGSAGVVELIEKYYTQELHWEVQHRHAVLQTTR